MGIIKRKWRTRGYAGSLQPPKEGVPISKVTALFCPMEKKFPLIRIATRQVCQQVVLCDIVRNNKHEIVIYSGNADLASSHKDGETLEVQKGFSGSSITSLSFSQTPQIVEQGFSCQPVFPY